MSRFGLRSASDGLKQIEEKPNRRKIFNPVSLAMKKTTQQKDAKYVTNIKDEALIDDIKIEIDDVEKISDTVDGQPSNKNMNDCDDDDDDDDGEVEDICQNYGGQFPSSFKGSLICSLPLERIHDVLQKLNLTKDKNSKPTGENDDVDESLDNDDEDEDDSNTPKQSTSTVKNLCLYCDKKFASHKMQLKHVEKFHCLQQDRRCSGRNSQLQQTQTPRKRKPALGSQIFTGCTFCPRAKGSPQSVMLPASDLSALFLHLSDIHADRYFGCKICIMRFQNIAKLSKHMEIVHKSLSFAFDENSSKSKDNDTDSPVSNEKPLVGERNKVSLRRQHRSQKLLGATTSNVGSSSTITPGQITTPITPNTSVIGAEEPILSRLGLTQNRLPNNRKGVRLRREKLIPEMLLKSEQNHQPSPNYSHTLTTSSSLASSTCSPKLRGKSLKTASGLSGDPSSDVIFRVPTRNDILSCVFDDNFYKEVVSNVRNNLLFHLDGKIMGNTLQYLDSTTMRNTIQPQIRSTLVKSPIVITSESEIHAATSLSAITAFPTLLTAEQFGGDGNSSKIRRPHTKNSWKWKWDSVKKFKLVNEGGKIVKKMKHPMLGLRDLSKLDMWTQLTMRQKHEMQSQQTSQANDDDNWSITELPSDPSREEKQRLNDQLNMILDMRLLPHIILEQNEQAIIKLENDEFGIGSAQPIAEDSGDNFMAQTFADESFLSMLNLLPSAESRKQRMNIVLSGEWARPRCYLCMCCGAKFEKLKSLEEHKMFRHSQILSTHYEVVGRELLNGNLLRHLFLPKKALSRYANDMGSSNLIYTGAARRLFWHKNETLVREIANNEESSDSLQSMLNSCTTNSLSIKNSSSTEDCEADTKITPPTALGLIASNTIVVSPTHSIQSSSSSTSSVVKSNMKLQNTTQSPTITNTHVSGNSIYGGNGCSKCGRKCNGVLDLYRHMLDCSGDYVWSLAKKRKYRYYCGSKKRRPCNKHSILELRKNKSTIKPTAKLSNVPSENTEDGPNTSINFTKSKTSPRPRPSDAESIKKMLENLPPKRVCKKIFPAVNKTKKNLKPKLLAKHKIYNSLRKTRVRQMSQAAKILSKTKSQLQKSKQMTTRSATALSIPTSSKRKNTQKKPVKILSGKNGKSKGIEKPPSSPVEKEEHLNEVRVNIKVESIKPSSEGSDTVGQDNQCTTIETSSNMENLNKSLHGDNDNNKVSTEAGTNSVVLPTTVASSSGPFLDTSQSEVQIIPPIADNDQLEIGGKKDINTTNPAVLPVDSDRNALNSKNVKRSKRISDCIAMLTGKLEQKLKTEQNVSTPKVVGVKSDFNRSVPSNITQRTLPKPSIPPEVLPFPTATTITPAILPVLPAAIPPAMPHVLQSSPPSQVFQDKLLPSPMISDKLECHSADKATALKKTPKRKAISRRIVKNNAMNEAVSPIRSVECNIPPSTSNTIEVSAIPKENLHQTVLPKNGNEQMKTLPQTQSTKATDIAFIPVDGKLVKTFPSSAVGPPLPPILPLNSQQHISKVPLYMPMENLCAPQIATIPSLPLPLPMPIPPPPSIHAENIVQPPAGVHAITAGPSALSLLPPSAAIPLITTLPPAHLPGPSPVALPLASFSIPTVTEPLNLSSSSKNLQKQSQDLSFSNRNKGCGIPARRQTICGFEARNFLMFDEMEPLDLSKKPRQEKNSPSSVATVLPKTIDMSSILLSGQQPNSITTIPTMDGSSHLPMPVPPLTPEALLNKPFYSNLDLLRIPQVRNPVVGQNTPTVSEPTPPPPPVPVPPIISGNVPIPKPIAKKRNKPCIITTTAATIIPAIPIENQANTSQTAIKPNVTKEPPILAHKKEGSLKGKNTRMDEEVINHIDDAINSVINAVKASIDSEEAEKSTQELISTLPTSLPKTTDDMMVSKESVGEFKYLSAARRNVRSKTLDCRPAALCKLNSTTTNSGNQFKEEVVKTQPIIANVVTQAVPDDASGGHHLDCPPALKENSNLNDCSMLSQNVNKVASNSINDIPIVKQTEPQEIDNNIELVTNIISDKITTPKNIVQGTLVEVDDVAPQTITSVVERNECTKVPDMGVLVESDAQVTNPPPATNSILDLEQMSNNNNTSSGFHSSAQSDHQTSVMSATTTSASTSMVVMDTKKKQRRRRKNELAAIVADQLLESFKLDKARRDNLKKLENLAYEKSEDLLLTGMLLMSSTKRNVTSSSTTNNSPATAAPVTTDNNENSGKRSSKSQTNSQISKPTNASTSAENKLPPSKNEETDKAVAENLEVSDGKKNNKRRQCRRRGKTLDNENISKLKSSLESFSIDIERQLSEYEAKNVNVFKNVSGNDVSKTQTNSKSQLSSNTKSSVILRPSILSMTLEASANIDNAQTGKSIAPAVVTTESNKTVISSRDPRLNKNIHKEGENNCEKYAENKTATPSQKPSKSPEEIGDLDEDNYLTEIAKNVNAKIMSTENEEFAFKDDGFEMANDMGMDDSNSKFSRPPTSMSVRSAPNFNDDRSNFGSVCDENTNTEVMDMDLDDEMSVYTSYSQDLGRGRGRRRRRRRSILLTRKPKKRASSRDLSSEKIECILCKKVFYSANSLTKHNMTLAHVSKVSEQEYLLSKSLINSSVNLNQNNTPGTLGPYARRSTRRATISEPPMHMQTDELIVFNPMPTTSNQALSMNQTHLTPNPTPFKPFISHEAPVEGKKDIPSTSEVVETPKAVHTPQITKDIPDNDYGDGNNVNVVNAPFNGNSRLNLNPDERLFFECCNILKSAETPRINNAIVPEVVEECNNINTNYDNYSFRAQDKPSPVQNNSLRSGVTHVNMDNTIRSGVGMTPIGNVTIPQNQQPSLDQSTYTPNCYNRPIQDNRNARSPTYSAISHLSAVTNTTSRFKTKAAMKGYENVNIDLLQQQESKSRTICKLTELAEIALGNEDKPNSHGFSPIQNSNVPSRPLVQTAPCASKVDTVAMDVPVRMKGAVRADYHSLIAVDNQKESNIQLPSRNERTKNNETRSSTSSKTIMHSSIIKAAVEEHQKTPSCNKIIIPDRPFKNIGLEEKETITFQKPKTPAVNLLTEDNNSVSTGSFSDRDDYDFGSLSCDEEISVRESNEKHPKNNSSESSSESSRATAKTFENKSLIMGRIFKNVSTKASVKNNVTPAVKVKSIGIQKDQPPVPKADLNQLFDELRGNSGVEGSVKERLGNKNINEKTTIVAGSSRQTYKPAQRETAKSILPAASPPAIVSSTKATPLSNPRSKSKVRESRAKGKISSKTPKDISKLQTELGMSPDEIKKLIDEGQRKSKRRCATNRPKKLIEMWSSDEYEEFLSTKDIIALIEEKEQKEKRKKRKNSVNISSNTSEIGKEKDIIDVTSSTKDSKRRNTRKSNVTVERVVGKGKASVETTVNKYTKAKSSVRKDDLPMSTQATQRGTLNVLPEKTDPKSASIDNSKTKCDTSSTKTKGKLGATKTKKEAKPKTRKGKTDKLIAEDNNNDSAEDNEEDFSISDLKKKQANKKNATKAKQTKPASISASTIISTENLKGTKSSMHSSQSNKKRTTANTSTPTESAKSQKSQPAAKNKRKGQSNQSPTRRKRPATEKLYYWSSSSDEEFGRIDNNKGNNVNANTNTDNFDVGGEQYQKHGWIVGDSHKKLVTLLAIAKGNKKVDGVKKNVTKKRS
ncbi:uncharacterized protein LOC142227944 [Haematobia irritans]|uniref:uncharacterized protein LOC142227944 n=1 Tax=Haematobia irritans TaxID=7368 RepID=UPI003F509B72